MPNVTAQSRPVRADDVVHFPNGEATYLHHLASGEYFELNDVGAELWELCEGQLTIDEIAAHLAEDFDAGREQIVQDIVSLVGELAEEDCVVLA